jgi:hypothetical protein
MFGHLQAEDFTNLIEGIEVPSNRRLHLQACAKCEDAFVSAQSIHAEIRKSAMHEMDELDIPEPDWFQFRTDVRTAMLSRAAQRQAKTNSWTGWLLRPAMTWGLAFAFTAGLSAGLLIWNGNGTTPASSGAAKGVAKIESTELPDGDQVASLDVNDSSSIPDEVTLTLDSSTIESGLTTWSQTSVFDELSRLSDAQGEKLQRILEADAQHVTTK